MTVEVPPWVAEMFHVLTGDGWPAADENAINDLGRLWVQVGNRLGEFAPEVTRSARVVADSGALVGDAQKALTATVTFVTGDGGLTLEKLAAGFEELGGYLHRVALQTQYMKIIVLEELIILAAQIAYLIAMIPWTFGASAAGVAALQVSGRAFAIAVMRQLTIAIAASEVLQVGLDAIAQLAQLAEGWRKGGEWDWNLTRSAAITGVVGGVLGPVFHGLGHHPGTLLGKAASGALGTNAGHEAADRAADVLKAAGHEYVTDGVSGLVQGGRWRPDTFSLTAGAADEGGSGLARIGRRTGGHRFSQGLLSGGEAGLPGAGISIPNHSCIDPPAAKASGRVSGLGVGSRRWWGSSGVVQVRRAGNPQVPDLTRFWDPGPTHRVAAFDDGADQQSAGQQAAGQQAGTSLEARSRPGIDIETRSTRRRLSEADAGAGAADTLDLARARRSREEKLALLADYEQAVLHRKGRAWQQEHGLNPGHITQWRRLRQAAQMSADDPRLAAAAPHLSTEQQAVLVREYQEAITGGTAQAWLTEKNLTKARMTRWQGIVRATQQPAIPSDPGDPDAQTERFANPVGDVGPLRAGAEQAGSSSAFGSTALSPPGPIEVDPGQEVPVDDLAQAPVRRSRQEKMDLLAEYERAVPQLQGRAWLREHGLNPGHITQWRQLRQAAELPVDHPRLAAAAPHLSSQQQAVLVREYQEAVTGGTAQAWLAERNLTKARMTRWQGIVRATRQLAMPDDRGGPDAQTERFADPVGDVGPRLAGAGVERGASDSASTSLVGPIEVDPGQAFTVDDLDWVRPRRSSREKLALLAEYEQAVVHRKGTAWLRERRINRGRLAEWRHLREVAELSADDSRIAAAPAFMPPEQQAVLVREYQEAVTGGTAQAWLTEKNLTKARMTRWQNMLRATQHPLTQPAMPDDRCDPDAQTEIMVDPAGVDPGQAFPVDDPAPAPARRSRQEKLALLAEYEQAVMHRKGGDWLWERRINSGRIAQWRRLRRAAELSADDPRLAAAAPHLSRQQQAVLVREYQEAVTGGTAQAWLAEKNLTKVRITRWQNKLRATRHPAPQPVGESAARPVEESVPELVLEPGEGSGMRGDSGTETEVMVEAVGDFGSLACTRSPIRTGRSPSAGT